MTKTEQKIITRAELDREWRGTAFYVAPRSREFVNRVITMHIANDNVDGTLCGRMTEDASLMLIPEDVPERARRFAFCRWCENLA